MKCLLVTAHPLAESLCMSLRDQIVETLQTAGHDVVTEDLYQKKFDPVLTEKERKSYYDSAYDSAAIEDEAGRLLEAEAVVLVFPTWWFGFPAVLKGWFDRIWAPGIAYDHAADFGPIRPKLHQLKKMLAVTTLGAPWWVDYLIMRRPIRRILKIALLSTCAPNCEFRMFSLYKSENVKSDKIQAFTNRIVHYLRKWG